MAAKNKKKLKAYGKKLKQTIAKKPTKPKMTPAKKKLGLTIRGKK